MLVLLLAACHLGDTPAEIPTDAGLSGIPFPDDYGTDAADSRSPWNRIPDADPPQDTAADLAEDTAAPEDTGAEPTDDTGVPEVPLVAEVVADVVSGVFPLAVSFDASASQRGAGPVRSEWSFGDGATATTDGGAQHTYLGAGVFFATLTLTELDSGRVSVTTVAIAAVTPACPAADPALSWGSVDDGALDELSGIVASRVDHEAFWVHEDSGNAAVLTAIDRTGATLSRHPLPDRFQDWEDLAAAIDPVTGTPTLFLADIGDNAYARDEVAVWVAPEPDPRVDGALVPLRMGLTYPEGPRNAETLLVDPLTFDVYIVTKEGSGPASVYVKRAPHDDEGPFELEALGERASLGFTATAGDVSPDGSRIILRDYTTKGRMWLRDGYLPLEDAFDAQPCVVALYSEPQGEAIAFTSDGAGLVTVSEGARLPMHFVGL